MRKVRKRKNKRFVKGVITVPWLIRSAGGDDMTYATRTIAESLYDATDAELCPMLQYISIDGRQPTLPELRKYLRQEVARIRQRRKDEEPYG